MLIHLINETEKNNLDMPPVFRVVGLDFLLDEDGRWHFLEINDSPIGLAMANEMYENFDKFETRFQSPIELICDLLSRSVKHRNGIVALFLPYSWQLSNGGAGKSLRIDADDLRNNNLSNQALLSDINAIAAGLVRRDVDFQIMDVDSLKLCGENLRSPDGRPIDVVFNRLGAPPWALQPVNSNFVNDVRARSICKNKFLVRKIISNELKKNTASAIYLHRIKWFDVTNWFL